MAILEEEKKNKAGGEELAIRAKERQIRVEQRRREREVLDGKTAELRERRRFLLQEDEAGALEMSQIKESQ